MACSQTNAVGLDITSRAGGDGCTIAVLRGELDIASAPALREELIRLLRPEASHLIIDLSAVGYADASGVAVFVGCGRRAGLLGGWLRLASPAPEVARVLSVTGLNRHLATFPTVEAAIADRMPDTGTGDDAAGRVTRVPPGSSLPGPCLPAPCLPAPCLPGPPAAQHAADSRELRTAVTALLANADAWRDADPRRRIAPALHALVLAHAGASNAALTQAAHSLVSVLGREPLTHSHEVAATASRLRRLLYPDIRQTRVHGHP